ncbi:MAG: EthD domain-containing protein [Gammaproteobacteria bacterium]|nr:EthD domain-containing protein [Gammaproteobacteria bacterium]
MSAPLPGPWVNHETRDDEPWLTSDGIVKFIEFPVRKPGMSRRAFHLYWQRHHSPHVMNTTPFSQFMRKYMTGHVHAREVAGVPSTLAIPPQFEGVAEVWLNSLDDATAWLSHPLYAELIAPDEANFIDSSAIEVLVTREQRLHDPAPDLVETGLTKVHVMTRRAENCTRGEFHRAVSTHGKALLSREGLRAHLRRLVISHRLADPYPDWLPTPQIDAVLELWFDDLSAMQKFFVDVARDADLAFLAVGCLDRASMRAMVTRLHVVHDEFSFQPTTMQPGEFRWGD